MKIQEPFGKKTTLGDAPGTISYTGQVRNIPITIECIKYNDDELYLDKVKDVKGPFDPAYIYWFNVTGLYDVDLITRIGEQFSMHPMDLEDIVHVSQWSKIEDKDDYLFAILKMIYLKKDVIVREHLAMLHKDNVMITFLETPGDVFDGIRNRIREKRGHIRSRTSEFLFYALLDALVDQYFVVVNMISSEFRDLEIRILDNDMDSKGKIYQLRKELIYLTNSITPVKDEVSYYVDMLENEEDHEMTPYFGDLLEHLNQISDQLIAYKEMSNGLYEMHNANVSNDMNQTMMVLTIFSAIFIPLSFLAGVFGMNFDFIPGLHSKEAFYAFVGVCVLLAGGMLSFFKWKKWF